jgi:hypothetical protein
MEGQTSTLVIPERLLKLEGLEKGGWISHRE